VLEEHLKACEDQLREMEQHLDHLPTSEPAETPPENISGSPDLQALDVEMVELMRVLEQSSQALASRGLSAS
jgi:hypothetical protein